MNTPAENTAPCQHCGAAAQFDTNYGGRFVCCTAWLKDSVGDQRPVKEIPRRNRWGQVE